ncbi:class I SAM-dependent methyltransferase [Alphaproteobacteria bacterium]|nr:class I SAM-dependent methyltransferase [Alphaproteobacteria bacterium]
MNQDKNIERDRYDRRAQDVINDLSASFVESILSMPEVHRAPYSYYYECIKNQLSSEMKVLEIGAGIGAHTGVLLQSGAQVIASDISDCSLNVLANRYSSCANLSTQVADMECLPFGDEEFDLVTSAGSLSYGDNEIVMGEISRILKSNGVFICVDSLNHNPIYRLNRWMQYLRGKRTKSTIARMPTTSMQKKYKTKFGRTQVKFFGSLIWLSPVLRLFFGIKNTAIMIDSFDKFINVYQSAFKFVMVASKKI